MCKLPDAITNNDVDDLWERPKQYISNSSQYACKSWHKHFVDLHIVPGHTPRITSILHQFLEEKLLFWLEVLSVLGTVRDAVDALEVAGKWLEVCWVYILDIFCEFTYTKLRHHQLLTS